MSFPNERRLISIFKSFVQKALIPQIRKNQGSLSQWNKFSNMITADSINYNQLHLYVDTLPNLNLLATNTNLTSQPQSQYNDKNAQKKKEQIQNQEIGFNPNKTFGGERNKLSPFMFGQESSQARRESQRQESVRQRSQYNYSGILSSLEKLLKNLEENQSVIEGSQENGSGWQQEKVRNRSRQNEGSKKPAPLAASNNKSSSRPSNMSITTTPSNYNGSYSNPMTSPSFNYSQSQSNQGYRSYY